MSTDNDVLDSQMRDRIHNHRLGREVRGGEHVSDVAVHKHVAWLEAQHGRFGHAGVGAAEPEDGRVLACGEGGEEVWVGVGGCLGPLFVLVEGGVEGGVGCCGEGARGRISLERRCGSGVEVQLGG